MTDRLTDRQTTDRQTDNRQTENLNPSVPYDTFACFAGLIIIIITIIIITSRTREKFHGSCSGISLQCSVLSLIKENLRCS